MTCPKCGAPVTGPRCDYCGSDTGARLSNGAAYIGDCFVDVTASVDVSDELLRGSPSLWGRNVGGELRQQLINGLVERIPEYFDDIVEIRCNHDLAHGYRTFTAAVTLVERRH